MAKAIQKSVEDITTRLFHCGLMKIIITHELQKQDLTWQQFVIHNEFEEPEELLEEGLKEYEVLMITYIEDETHISKETISKNPKRRIRTGSMVKEELQFQEKDKVFNTYERRSRKHQQGQNKKAIENNDEEQ